MPSNSSPLDRLLRAIERVPIRDRNDRRDQFLDRYDKIKTPRERDHWAERNAKALEKAYDEPKQDAELDQGDDCDIEYWMGRAGLDDDNDDEEVDFWSGTPADETNDEASK
jgi:hypothetical protein